MEMTDVVERDQGLDEDYVNDAADVTTEHDFWVAIALQLHRVDQLL